MSWMTSAMRRRVVTQHKAVKTAALPEPAEPDVEHVQEDERDTKYQ